MKKYISQIEEIWNNYKKWPQTSENYKHASKIVRIVISMLDQGKLRICEKTSSNAWEINLWVKKAIILSFYFKKNSVIPNGYTHYYDKIPPKFSMDWDENDFNRERLRIVPGAYIRMGAYLGQNTVIMPSFINIGAYIDENTLIDSGANIGSCAQIGKSCHISVGVSIGGVLEPLQSRPVIIEDNCFIGAGSCIVEGILVEENCVIGSGVHLSASTKIYDQLTENITYGIIPTGSVVVPGSIKSSSNSNVLHNCAIIIKKIDNQTLKKTGHNEILRHIDN